MKYSQESAGQQSFFDSPLFVAPEIDVVVIADSTDLVATVIEPEVLAVSEVLEDAPSPKAVELPRYEILIRRIQKRPGYVTEVHDRERDCEELIHLFRYLIRKIATKTWRAGNSETREDWFQDTMTAFIEFVLSDYLPKEFGGSAMFGTYIQNKLFWKMVYAGQKNLEHSAMHRQTNFHAETASFESGDRVDHFSADLRGRILELSTGIEEHLIAEMRDEDVSRQLREVEEISKKVLDARELFLWDSFMTSPTTVRESGEKCNPPISGSRVHQIIATSRRKVLEEMGRRALKATLS